MDIELKNTEAYLRGLLDDMIEFTKSELDRSRDRGGFSSPITDLGNLANSLTAVINKSGSGTEFNMEGFDYAHAVDDGTDGGYRPPLDKMVGWVSRKVKNLQDAKGNSLKRTESNLRSVAYAISTKIFLRGVNRADYLSSIAKKYNDLISENISGHLVEDVLADLDTIMLDAGYIRKGNTYELKK